MRQYAIIAISLCTPALFAQGLVLDDFDSVVNDEAGGPREFVGDFNSDPFTGIFVNDTFQLTQPGGNVINGSLDMNSGVGVRYTPKLLYRNEGAGLNLDAASLGGTGFEFDFLLIDQDFRIEILLESLSGGGAAFKSGIQFAEVSEFTTYSVDFSSFATEGGFDFSDIDSITIFLNFGNVQSLDFRMTEFRMAVPAPSGAAALGLSGLVLGRRRRR